MRYHYVVNGYALDYDRQIEEQNYIKSMLQDACAEQREMIVVCKKREDVLLKGVLAEKVIYLENKDCKVETILEKIEKRVQADSVFVFGSDVLGVELAVRLGRRCCGASLTAVTEMLPDEGCGMRIRKMVYSNHMQAEFTVKKWPVFVSVAKGSRLQHFDLQVLSEEIITQNEKKDFIVTSEFVPEVQEEKLEDAKIIVAAGRGAGNQTNVDLLETYAKAVGGQIGVSRPAAMNAWEPMNHLIGVSGAMVAPEICITAGVSGAPAFYAGIEKSNYIVAINTNEKAPIMHKADVAVVDDFVPVIQELLRLIEEK